MDRERCCRELRPVVRYRCDDHVGYRGSGEVLSSGRPFLRDPPRGVTRRSRCLKRITPSVAEIQRMYVQPHVRGVGAGRLLLQQLLSDATAIGYDVVRLESSEI